GGDQRRRDLDDRIAAVIGAADHALLEEPRRDELAEQRLAVVVGEGLPRLLVAYELHRVEEARAPQVADDRQLEQLGERRPKGVAVVAHVLDDPLALHDLDVLERDRTLDRMAAE